MIPGGSSDLTATLSLFVLFFLLPKQVSPLLVFLKGGEPRPGSPHAMERATLMDTCTGEGWAARPSAVGGPSWSQGGGDGLGIRAPRVPSWQHHPTPLSFSRHSPPPPSACGPRLTWLHSCALLATLYMPLFLWSLHLETSENENINSWLCFPGAQQCRLAWAQRR